VFKPFVIFGLSLLLLLIGVAHAQDFRDEHRVKSLRVLKDVAIVIRSNTPKEVASISEFGDMLRVSLARNAPGLRVTPPQDSASWLELSVIAAEGGGVVEISLYRWVRVRANGEDVVAKVWDRSEAMFGGVSREALRETIEALVTRFGADYLRATKP
jgi:hypothetical protein